MNDLSISGKALAFKIKLAKAKANYGTERKSCF